ncbi:MAG: thioredoxin [Clostridia bacterium]|nr:thioredoxin [Clostridia bacterium]
MALKITGDNFEQEVLQSSKPVLVDFFADWCGPCQMLAPIIEDISDSDIGVKVGKVNVDEQMQLAMQFGVSSIPLLVLFKNGKPAAKMLGFHDKDDILEMIGNA